ncbi:hypothetical protein [Rhizobium ruizarguesonis]|uniref:hypothetical protein n=1 Tax=Rhizobium ruizarguesonis TaxID=2081791 RepID=UPI001038611C|nr:hypothetical protein [Rhizobium ruizarguesonis]TBB32454.1 hypothetical protein ELH47_11190 [Rhizobium ruizarguesonis]
MAETLREQVSRRPLAYWATIENYRWWLAHDQIYDQLLRETGGITADIIRTIAKAYGINRGISAAEDKDDDVTASAIARVLNEFNVVSFKKLSSLKDKVPTFRSIVDRMPMNVDRDKSQNPTFVSGTSKLIWFFAPEGWTMFDRLAADGAGIAKSLPSITRAERYYASLGDRGFEQTTTKIQAVLDRSAFKALHGERLIDKFLWLAGCKLETQKNTILMLHFYMDGLFPDVRSKLDALATKVADMLQSDLDALTKK